MFKNKEVTLVDRIRTYQRADRANKQCANCGEMGPVYICTDFHTFVCTECSGLHRELSHKVKSISMSNWTKDEVNAIETSGGNVKDRELYLASYDPKAFPQPASTNKERLREFIRAKYIERRWVASKRPPVKIHEPATIIPDSPIRVKKEKKDKKHVEPTDDLFTFSPSRVISNPVVEVPAIAVPEVTVSPEEEVQAHFSRGMESLERLYRSNASSAQLLASTVMESLRQQFLTTRTPTPAETPVVAPSSVTTTASSNPFDFLPSPSTAMIPVTSTLEVPPFMPMEQAPVPPVAHSNPFDFFQ